MLTKEGAGVMQWTMRLEMRTSAGELKTTELVTFSRPAVIGTLAEVGLLPAETKTLLARLQASMLCGQVAEYAAHHRACAACGVLQPLKDRRTRWLQILFGTVEVEAPRFKMCRCRCSATQELARTVAPVCTLLTARCTPELERLQAELGARTSFRDAARILETLLPASPANQESVRNRTHAVALRIEAADRQAATEATAVREPDEVAAADEHRPIVMLYGAYIRTMPGHQVRTFEAICGKVEHEGHPTRRFALVRSVAEQPNALLRAVLQNQGWREGDAVTAISDGDPALPALVRTATGGPVEHILDWFHLSMRLHHVEQVMGGLCAVELPPLAPLGHAQIGVERRHLLWNGHHEKACEALGRIVSGAKDAIVLNDPGSEAKARRLAARCTELRRYIENNKGALIDYGQRYRTGQPISTSRAESTVNQLVNARVNKRQQMHWSPRGAHRVLQVRAAVLDGRFGHQALRLAASCPRFLTRFSAIRAWMSAQRQRTTLSRARSGPVRIQPATSAYCSAARRASTPPP